MNSTILLITILASVVFVALGLLFIAGLLFRRDLDRIRASGFSAPELTRDPLTLKDTLVQFFAYSKGSSRIIRLLAARQKPLGYQALVDDIRFDEHWRRDSDPLPAGAILAQLAIMQVAGLARFTRHGFSITAVGRHVQQQIDPGPPTPRPQTGAMYSHSKLVPARTRRDAYLTSDCLVAASRRLSPIPKVNAIGHIASES